MEDKFEIGEALSQPFNATTSLGFLLRLVLWGTVLSLVLYIFMGKGLVDDFIGIMEFTNNDPGNDSMPPQFFSFMLKIFALLLWGWVIFILIEAAYHKNLLFGTDHGIFPFRLGNAELMVFLSHLILFGFIIIAYILLFLLIAVTFGIGILFAIPAFFGMIFVGIRLSPMAPLSVYNRKLSVGEAWEISKPHFWMMFVTFLIVAVASYIVMSVIQYGAMFSVLADFTAIEGLEGASEEESFAAIGNILKKPSVYIPLLIAGVIYLLVHIMSYIWYYGIGNLVVRLNKK